jgi:hypothetical protein
MPDVWTIGPTAAARALRACGFSPREAERLIALKLRYEAGAFREVTKAHKRLLFVRWLVEHSRLSDSYGLDPMTGNAVGTRTVSGDQSNDHSSPA